MTKLKPSDGRRGRRFPSAPAQEFHGRLPGHFWDYVTDHEYFTRHADDVLYEQEISISQEALGAQVEVPTLEGKVKLKIPAGTQTAKVFRLRGKGFPNVHGYGRGDELVKVVVKTPTNLSGAERKLFEELARLRGENVSEGNTIFDKVKKSFK